VTAQALGEVAIGIAVIALCAALLALRTLARIRRDVVVLSRGGRHGESVLEAAARQRAETAALRKEVSGWRDVLAGERTALASQLGPVARTVEEALRRVAVVHFDAFPDLGGRLSFSLAVLDTAGNGVVLTSIAGRAETRLYAKPVSDGRPVNAELLPEERDAIRAALAG
jgi:Protein of unknown function (DUF4446)